MARDNDPTTPVPRLHFLLARWIVGVVGGAALVHASAGVLRGRLAYTIDDDRNVALTAPDDLALGALCFATMGTLLLVLAFRPRAFRRPWAAIAGLVVFLIALGGLSWLE